MAYTSTGINNSATIVEKAGAAIEGGIGKAVKYDSNGDVVLASVAGEAVIGLAILTNAEIIAKGEDVDIQVKEIGKAVAGAEIAKGAELAVDANGALVTATGGQFVIGTALQAATAAGQIINVQITKYYKPEEAVEEPKEEEN